MQLLHEGVIGKVYLAKGLCFKRRKSIGHKPDGPVPPGVDWDKFLGPAPMRPFNELRFKYNWHWFWDTGNGDIGNQGIHEMDIARWGLGKPGCRKAWSPPAASTSTMDDQETPNTQIATFDYGDAELMFEVRGILTGPEGNMPIRGGNTVGNIFYGAMAGLPWTATASRSTRARRTKRSWTRRRPRRDTVAHMANFLAAIRARDYKLLHADIEIGVTSADLCHLANISYRLKRSLKFDDATRKFTGR